MSMDQQTPDIIVRVCRMSERAVLPRRATPGSSGFDLSSGEAADCCVARGSIVVVGTGLSLEIPEGFEGQVRSRSGLAMKHGLVVLNSPGTVDSDYRGEVRVILANLGTEDIVVHPGDRIAQLVIMQVPRVGLCEVKELSCTDRGEGGFGSSGV